VIVTITGANFTGAGVTLDDARISPVSQSDSIARTPLAVVSNSADHAQERPSAQRLKADVERVRQC
jgi:hypothetical protein